MNVHISRMFEMPNVKAYDRTGDPANCVKDVLKCASTIAST